MLELKNLMKSYGKILALDHFSMSVEQGQLFGFVGPNGAGKTTTMKVITGLLSPDSGSMFFNGEDALKDAGLRKQKIGYMPDFFGVYDNLKVSEYMEFYLDIYGYYGENAKKKSQNLLDLVGLLGKREAFVDHLSRGMKQRLCLARTLIHDPELLVLDEPASGMGPYSRKELKEILRQLCAEGKTILLSSHILTELSEMCTNIGIIDHGSLIMQGSIEEIKRQQKAANPIQLQLAEGTEEAFRVLKEHPLASNIASKSGSISFSFSGERKEEAQLLTTLIYAGVKVSSFKRDEGSLEALFLRLTKDSELEDLEAEEIESKDLRKHSLLMGGRNEVLKSSL